MNIALYRRYRPDTFAAVIGQEQVTRPLMAAVDAGRINHAYLFSGPRGCGKTTCARIMARCLNCAEGPTANPCGKCPSCVELATGNSGSLDVIEIDAASHNGVDDARDLRERAAFAPVRDRFKIFILDEAHMVTSQGFNALLKLVEEPPEHVKFIFATTEPEKVIGTIRSRTHHYPFRLVAPEILRTFLADLCRQEEIIPDEGVLELVIRAGGGSVRDSLSVLDQLMAATKDGKLDYQVAIGLLGYTDSALLEEVIDAIIDQDATGLFQQLENVIESGLDPRRFLEDLLLRLRDLMLLGFSGSRVGNLAALPQAQLEYMQAQLQRWNPAGISRAADLTATTITNMTGTVAPRLQIELLGARLLAPSTGIVNPAPDTSIPAANNAVGDGSVNHRGETKPATSATGQDSDIEASMAAARAALAASRKQPSASGQKPAVSRQQAPASPEHPHASRQQLADGHRQEDTGSTPKAVANITAEQVVASVVAPEEIRAEIPQWELVARSRWPQFAARLDSENHNLFCLLNQVCEPLFVTPGRIQISVKDENARAILQTQQELLQATADSVYPEVEVVVLDEYQPSKLLSGDLSQILLKQKAELAKDSVRPEKADDTGKKAEHRDCLPTEPDSPPQEEDAGKETETIDWGNSKAEPLADEWVIELEEDVQVDSGEEVSLTPNSGWEVDPVQSGQIDVDKNEVASAKLDLSPEEEISFDDEDAKTVPTDVDQVLKEVLRAKKIEEINLKE